MNLVSCMGAYVCTSLDGSGATHHTLSKSCGCGSLYTYKEQSTHTQYDTASVSVAVV